MKLSHLSLILLLPITCALSAMDDQSGGQPGALAPLAPGLPTIIDNTGTLLQHTLAPGYIASKVYKECNDGGEALTAFCLMFLINKMAVEGSKWLFDWPRSSSLDATSNQEQSIQNGIKNVANQGIKIGMSVVPFAVLGYLSNR